MRLSGREKRKVWQAPGARVEAGAGAEAPPSASLLLGVVVLAEVKLGRVLLHLACAVRTGHIAWHWRGILREFRA